MQDTQVQTCHRFTCYLNPDVMKFKVYLTILSQYLNAAAHHTFEQLGGCPMPERHAEHEPTLGHLWAHLCLLLCMKRAPGHLSPRHNQRYCPFLLPSNAVSCHRQVSGPPNSAPSANDFCSIGAFVTFYDKYIIWLFPNAEHKYLLTMSASVSA